MDFYICNNMRGVLCNIEWCKSEGWGCSLSILSSATSPNTLHLHLQYSLSLYHYCYWCYNINISFSIWYGSSSVELSPSPSSSKHWVSKHWSQLAAKTPANLVKNTWDSFLLCIFCVWQIWGRAGWLREEGHSWCIRWGAQEPPLSSACHTGMRRFSQWKWGNSHNHNSLTMEMSTIPKKIFSARGNKAIFKICS